ncbi:MFS transporter [Micromonospora sp. DR5-3]|uniref:MFS transporter n=1 Tax=unclassified Micromonospora TaxID=2617518 RepID=UPI0016527E93|nr:MULTISPECIES: MFS transporter [unclassified Micromonospora]MCW3820419.1 MFS transporter [Micromonospora sp. DR5-3]
MRDTRPGAGTAFATPAGRETLPGRTRAGLGVLLTLLGATLLGTVINNVLNVPLRDITADLGVSLSSGVLVVSSFVLVLAASMALSGWVGDRFGRRRTVIASLALMAVAMVGAALAPSLPVLVAMRALQGMACAAYPPAVMGMLASIYGPSQRTRTMSAWAAANGIGQAMGPPLGGLLADLAGWRAIFWCLAPVAAILLVTTVLLVPDDRGHGAALHWPGALSLTLGAAFLMTAATTVPQHLMPPWATGTLAVAGVALLAVFAISSTKAVAPIIRPRLIIESRFLRSAVAAAAQMFCLAATLVAVPLYLTGTLGRATAVTGLLVLALPAAMAVLAPVVGLLSERGRPRLILRTGLVLLGVAELLVGLYTGSGGRSTPLLVALLLTVGVGVALVQTPSAAGATRSPAGRSGAALGLFNMMRFGGSALGAAWVAVVYPHGALPLLFAGCTAVAAIGLVVSFVGPDPSPLDVHAPSPTTTSG